MEETLSLKVVCEQGVVVAHGYVGEVQCGQITCDSLNDAKMAL